MPVKKASLEVRFKQFQTNCLPGQPRFMHMGTAYLVNDLMLEVRRLRDVLNKIASRQQGGIIKNGDYEGAAVSAEEDRFSMINEAREALKLNP